MDRTPRLIAIAFVVLASCNGHPNDFNEGSGSSGSVTASPNAVTSTGETWDNYAKAFFQKNCVNCHPNYATEAGVDSDLAGISQSIANGSMPTGATLTQTQQDNITAWLTAEQTALNNPNGTSAPSDPNSSPSDPNASPSDPNARPSAPTTGACTADTYANYGQAFFSTHCTGCHPSMSSYSVVVAESASIQQDISSGSMPQGTQLDAATKTRVLSWINCGMPE